MSKEKPMEQPMHEKSVDELRHEEEQIRARIQQRQLRNEELRAIREEQKQLRSLRFQEKHPRVVAARRGALTFGKALFTAADKALSEQKKVRRVHKKKAKRLRGQKTRHAGLTLKDRNELIRLLEKQKSSRKKLRGMS